MRPTFSNGSEPRSIRSRTTSSSRRTTADRTRSYNEILKTIGRKGDLASKVRESLVSIGRLLLYLANEADSMRWAKEQRAQLRGMQRDVHSLSDHAAYLSNKIQFLLDAMLGVVTIEQNNIIKIFSVAAVALMPPTLIASIYGMNFHHMPELDWNWGYPIAIGLMVARGRAAVFLLQVEEVAVSGPTEREPQGINLSRTGRRPQTCWPPLMWISAPFTYEDMSGAQHVDDLGDLVGGAEAVQRNLVGHDVLGAGGEDRGIDLARRDGVDADAERTEVRRHLAGQRRQCCLRRGIGRARERMHARAGDRGDIDHRTFCGLELFQEPARERDRREEIHAKNVVPNVDGGVDRGQP